ncbi:anaphase-promoting complex subunit 7-like [Argonauta hians]
MNLFENVKRLYDCELYSDLKQLASLVLTMSDQNSDLLTLAQKYQCTVYYAHSLYQLREFRKAESLYRKALLLKKVINKTKGKNTSHVEITSEVEVKYKIHLCHCKLKQYKEAINVLEGVIAKKRNAKINLALAHLYKQSNMDRPAITCFKEVIRECPLAVEALMGLISLGVKCAEVIGLVLSSLPHGTNYDWLTMWIKAHALVVAQEYTSAISTFKALDCKPYLKNNVRLLFSLGEAHFLNGDYTQAMQLFERAHLADRLNVKNMDTLAYLYLKEKKMSELESLANHVMKGNEHIPEPWVVIGYYCMANRKVVKALPKAAYFALKAYTIDNRNIEALLLKGFALMELKKLQDAASHFREALTLAPYRFEAHKGLIDCYMASHRPREAINLAGKAVRQLGNNARSLTLYASVLSEEPTTAIKAKQYVEKAMKLDSSYLEAVYVMTVILGKEQQYDKAIELLRKTLVHHNTCHLHQMLGDFLSQTNEALEAVNHYSIALRMDPANLPAKEGIQRIEKQTDNGLEGSYDMEVEDMEGSDNDVNNPLGDLEGSDVESNWSETDFS